METILISLAIAIIFFFVGFYCNQKYFRAKVSINITELKSDGTMPLYESSGNVDLVVNGQKWN